MGRLASELLLKRLGDDEEVPGRVKVPVELIVRGSCGAKRMSSLQVSLILERLLDSDLVDLAPCESDESHVASQASCVTPDS